MSLSRSAARVFGLERRRLWTSAAALSLLTAGMAMAEPVTLTGDAIKSTVVGKTVDLDTPLGTPITVTYKDNGSISGTVGTALSIYLGAASDRGRWWVANGRLCQKFFKWLEGETSCLSVRQDGRRIFWTREDGKSGTATILAGGPDRQPPPYGLGVPVPPAQEAAPTQHHAAPQQLTPKAPAAPKIAPTIAMVIPFPQPVRPPVTQASLAPADAVSAYQPAVAAPRPDLEEAENTIDGPVGLSILPSTWSTFSNTAQDTLMARAMVKRARHANAAHRWCHEVRDYRLLLRPEAVDAEAPELLTVTRHLHEAYSKVPPASCLGPAPALQDVARQLVDGQ